MTYNNNRLQNIKHFMHLGECILRITQYHSSNSTGMSCLDLENIYSN